MSQLFAYGAIIITNNNTIGIGTSSPGYKLDVQGGDINASGSVRSNGTALTSDQRVKENIVNANTQDNLNHILALQLRYYDYTQEFLDHTKRQDESNYGFIAQEVKEIIPNAIDIQHIKLYKEINEEIFQTYPEDTPAKDDEGNPILDSEGNQIIYLKGDPILDSNGEQIIINKKETIITQDIPDFHFLKKELIFTEAVGAIQELHKQLQIEKNAHEETKEELQEVKQELNTLKLFIQSKYPNEI
jgi:hypothetical protein